MIENVSFLPAAIQDIRDCHDWYEKQRTALGKDFTKEVLEKIEELQNNIAVHRTFFADVRYAKLQKFPYTIFYRLDEKQQDLLIVAVLGNKQDQLAILSQRFPS